MNDVPAGTIMCSFATGTNHGDERNDVGAYCRRSSDECHCVRDRRHQSHRANRNGDRPRLRNARYDGRERYADGLRVE